jgi:hypothetical protein
MAAIKSAFQYHLVIGIYWAADAAASAIDIDA